MGFGANNLENLVGGDDESHDLTNQRNFYKQWETGKAKN